MHFAGLSKGIFSNGHSLVPSRRRPVGARQRQAGVANRTPFDLRCLALAGARNKPGRAIPRGQRLHTSRILQGRGDLALPGRRNKPERGIPCTSPCGTGTGG